MIWYFFFILFFFHKQNRLQMWPFFFLFSLWLCKTHKAFPWAWLIFFSDMLFIFWKRGVHVSLPEHISLGEMTEEADVTRTSLGTRKRLHTGAQGGKTQQNPDPVSWKALVFCLQVFISRNQEYWWAKWLQSSSPQSSLAPVTVDSGPTGALPHSPRPLRHTALHFVLRMDLSHFQEIRTTGF